MARTHGASVRWLWQGGDEVASLTQSLGMRLERFSIRWLCPLIGVALCVPALAQLVAAMAMHPDTSWPASVWDALVLGVVLASCFAPRVCAWLAISLLVVMVLGAPRIWLWIDPTLAFIPAFAAAAHGRPRIGATSGVATIALMTVQAARAWPSDGGAEAPITSLVLWLVQLTAALLVGIGLHQAQLASCRARERALERQRADIARELHDTAAQAFAAIVLRAEQREAEGRFTPADLRFFAERGISALRDLRGMLAQLREDAAIGTGLFLGDALRDAEHVLREAGFAPAVAVDGDIDALPRPASVTLGAVLREAVANVRRHGEPQDGCVILVEIGPEVAELVVLNAPVRVSPRREEGARHWGIAGMRERVEARGGILQAERGERQWVLRAVLPVGVQSAASRAGV